MRANILVAVSLVGLAGALRAAADPVDALAFDATLKEYTATSGQHSVQASFNVTNVSASDVVITQVLTSCGCTVAKLPSQPWILKPGESGQIGATLTFAGGGVIAKNITVVSSAGNKTLTIKVLQGPQPGSAEAVRIRNQAIAAADRQAVLRNDCAKCHLEPAYGKTGRELYVAVCAVCHEAAQRASMVPDLRAVNRDNDTEFWRNRILHGRAGSLMPALGQAAGGPLDEKQVSSLIAYLSGDYRNDSVVGSNFPRTAPTPSIAAPPPTEKPLKRPPNQPFITPAARRLLANPPPPPPPTDPNDPAYTLPEEQD